MSLTVKNISGGYGKNIVCKNISFSIQEGEILCVLGPNGCGKSTLFKIIIGFLKKTSGELLFFDEPIHDLESKKRAKIISYIPQQHVPQFSLSVFDMVLMGRTAHVSPFSVPKQEDSEHVLKALETMNISSLKNKNYSQLSGGQRQSVLIARAICQGSKILIMDEPTSNLDYYNRNIVMKTIKNLAQNNFSVLLSTHSPEIPRAISDKILLMKQGSVMALGNVAETLTEKNIRELYSIADSDFEDFLLPV